MADACDCATAEPTREEALKSAEVAFEGRSLGSSGEETTFLVETATKGAAVGDRVRVRADASSCGYRFMPGDRVAIFAPRVDGALRLAQCSPKIPSRVELPAVVKGGACGCAGGVGDATTPLESIDGRVLKVREDARHRWITVKAKGGKKVRTIVTPADACGVTAKAGARVSVAGSVFSDGTLAVGACTAGSRITIQR